MTTKKVITTLITLSLVLLPAIVQAQLIAYDGIDYVNATYLDSSNGSAADAGWGAAWAATGGSGMYVASESGSPKSLVALSILPHTGLRVRSSSSRSMRTLDKTYSNETVYISYMMQPDSTNEANYAAFELYNGGTDSFANRVLQLGYLSADAGAAAGTGTFALNVRTVIDAGLGLDTNTVVAMDNRSTNTQFFVIRLTLGAGDDTVDVWQNPTWPSDETSTSYSITNMDVSFDRVSFASYTSGGATRYDEIRVGTTWEDVFGTDVIARDQFFADPAPATGEYDSDLILAGQNPVVDGFTGPWTLGSADSPDVFTNGLAYTGVASDGGSIGTTNKNVRYGRVLDTGTDYSGETNATVYMSFMMQLTTPDLGVADYRAFELYNGVLTSSSNRKLQIGVGQDGSDWGVRLFNNSTSGFYGSMGAPDTNVNFFVVKINLVYGGDVDSIQVWRNPENLASESASTIDYEKVGFNLKFDSVVVARFDGSGGALWDEIRFGNSWDSVIQDGAGSAPPPVTTPPALAISLDTASGTITIPATDLSDGSTYSLERNADLLNGAGWTLIDTFTASGTSSNLTTIPSGTKGIYRIR